MGYHSISSLLRCSSCPDRRPPERPRYGALTGGVRDRARGARGHPLRALLRSGMGSARSYSAPAIQSTARISGRAESREPGSPGQLPIVLRMPHSRS